MFLGKKFEAEVHAYVFGFLVIVMLKNIVLSNLS